MKFKIGDKVKIVSLKYTGACFGLNKSKRSLLDKTVIIQDISSVCSYIINGWNFHVYDLRPITTDLEVE
jgi:hypothetical protein